MNINGLWCSKGYIDILFIVKNLDKGVYMKSALTNFVNQVGQEDYLDESMRSLIKLIDSFDWTDKHSKELSWISNVDSPYIDGHLNICIYEGDNSNSISQGERGSMLQINPMKKSSRFPKGGVYRLKIELVLFYKEGKATNSKLYKTFTSRFNDHCLSTKEDIKEVKSLLKQMEYFLNTGSINMPPTIEMNDINDINDIRKLIQPQSTPYKYPPKTSKYLDRW